MWSPTCTQLLNVENKNGPHSCLVYILACLLWRICKVERWMLGALISAPAVLCKCSLHAWVTFWERAFVIFCSQGLFWEWVCQIPLKVGKMNPLKKNKTTQTNKQCFSWLNTLKSMFLTVSCQSFWNLPWSLHCQVVWGLMCVKDWLKQFSNWETV